MEASDLLRPPSYPGSLEEFLQRVNESPESWYNYISLADSQLNQLASNVTDLRTRSVNKDTQLVKLGSEIQKLTYQLEFRQADYDRLQQKLIHAEKEKELAIAQAQATTIPNTRSCPTTPTPTSTSPKESLPVTPLRGPTLRPRDSQQWSSPAFLKRGRLSDGPLFDPLADGVDDDQRDNKRRRKSYRDWNAWKYATRTPSPEKEDDQKESPPILSPAGQAQPQRAPLSPPKTENEEMRSEDHSPTSEIQDVQDPTVQEEVRDVVAFGIRDSVR